MDTVRPGATGRAPAPVASQGAGILQGPGQADFEQGWLCPGLWFQFHDVTVQTCGLQAPVAAASPFARPPARPERPSPLHAETAARPLARPCAHQPPVSGRAQPCVELSPARGRGLCAALTQLVLGGGGGGRSHVAPGSERGRGGRPARGARGRRRAVSRRAAGAQGRLGSLTRAALRPRGPPAACASSALRASLSPRLASSRLGSSLSLAPRRSRRRRRPCGRVTARRLFGSAPGLLASRRLLYLERAEPSSPPPPPPAPRAPALARSLARASSYPPAAAKLPPRAERRRGGPTPPQPCSLSRTHAASDLSRSRSP